MWAGHVPPGSNQPLPAGRAGAQDFIVVKLVGGIGDKVVKNCDDGPVNLDKHPRPLAELRHHSKETLQDICLANYED